jgi:hypothetical protein
MMLKYKVIKTFIDGSVTRNVGDAIEADGNRLAKLLQYRLIGLVNQEEKVLDLIDEAKVEEVESPEQVEEAEIIPAEVEEKPKPRQGKKGKEEN